jgi:hypothetical protein
MVRRGYVLRVSGSCEETSSDGLNVPGASGTARYVALKIDLGDCTVTIAQLPDSLIPPSKPETSSSAMTSSERHLEISSHSSDGPSTIGRNESEPVVGLGYQQPGLGASICVEDSCFRT